MTVPALQAAEDELTDVSIEQLVFDVLTRGKHGLSTGVGDFLTDGKLIQTMKGATTLELDFLDRDYKALQEGLFGTRIEVVVDNVPFRLTSVSLVDTERLRAFFEHRLIAELREHTKPLKASRGSITRAMFILKMLKELHSLYTFYCPELRRHQPIKAPTRAELEAAAAEQGSFEGAAELGALGEVGRAPGIAAPPGGGSLKAEPNRSATRGAEGQFTQHQLDEASTLLSVAIGLNAPQIVLEAILCAGFGESTMGDGAGTYSPNSAGYWGVLQAGSGQKGSVASGIDAHDTAQMAYYFCKGGKGSQAGGAIAYAAAHRGVDPGTIATEVEKSGEPGSFYGKFQSQAQDIISKYHGGGASFFGGGASAPSPTVKTATYEFTRGYAGQAEDSYTCALRLASEVLWRFFVVGRKSGRQSIYFVQDDDLYKAKPRYRIDPVTKGVRKFTFDVEVGKRTIVVKGRRQPKPSEAILAVRMDRWDAPPGTVIEVADYGPGDGKWLVDSIERNLYEKEGVVHLRAPEKPLPEARSSPGQTAANAASRSAAGSQGAAELAALGGSTAASPSIVSNLAQQHPELKQGVRDVVAVILTRFPSLTITSTLRPQSAGSYHAVGRACDLAGANMDTIGAWIAKELGSRLVEGIHNPTLSVKDGKAVPTSFWGASTWAGHVDHVHVAV